MNLQKDYCFKIDKLYDINMDYLYRYRLQNNMNNIHTNIHIYLLYYI